MDLAFRLATAADIPALHQLVESAYRGESAKRGWTHEADLLGGQRIDPAMLAAQVADPAQVILVAEAAGALLGCVALVRQPDHAYLGMLTVAPNQQGRGLGDAILRAAEAQARALWQAPRIDMRVISQRAELVAWYVRRGYADSGRCEPFPYGDTRFGEPKRADLQFVVLSKALGA
jgi:ribosomal protein S18 acetylase RimI-like enzyme